MKSTEYQFKEYRFYSVNIQIPLRDLSGTPLNNFVQQLKLEVASPLWGYTIYWLIHREF